MSVRSGILPTEPGEEGGVGAEAKLSPGQSPAGAGPRLGGRTVPQPARGEGEGGSAEPLREVLYVQTPPNPQDHR